jgi:hypothetical protein
MAKRLHRKKARKDRIYREIGEEVHKQLSSKGYFLKTTVLTQCGCEAWAQDIRWDYIVEFYNQDHDTELVPVTRKYRHGKTITNEMVALGEGPRTAGYALITQGNEQVIARNVQWRAKMAEGALGEANKVVQFAERAGIKSNLLPSKYEINRVEQLELLPKPNVA